MKRRALLILGLTGPLLAAAQNRHELLHFRRAGFEEVGDSVLLSLGLPELLSVRDVDAIDSIDSGFTTTLTFTIRVHRTGSNALVDERHRTVKIQWNPWKERYTTQIQDEGKGVSVRSFTDRNQAIKHATQLDRVKIAQASALDRGVQATYFVIVVGQRNPLEPQHIPQPDISLSEQSRDLSVFSRWIGIFIREVPRAEKTFAIRTSPAFYLVEQ